MKRVLIVLLLLFFYSFGHALAKESVFFAIDPSKEPMQFIAEDGKIAGFEIDFLHELGRQAGFTPV